MQIALLIFLAIGPAKPHPNPAQVICRSAPAFWKDYDQGWARTNTPGLMIRCFGEPLGRGGSRWTVELWNRTRNRLGFDFRLARELEPREVDVCPLTHFDEFDNDRWPARIVFERLTRPPAPTLDLRLVNVHRIDGDICPEK
ncbi:MAG TPA: hypothetical protein VHL58_18580 [Thermoanaerobaculia bacterium]|nr:hypothetical protein [Thermoanaerobaculia bacterium]